jgi:hypothetical protein
MNPATEILNKLDIDRGMSEVRAIAQTREYLDRNANPLRAANFIITKFNIPPVDNVKKAYVFAMTAVEQSLKTDTPDIQSIMDRANARIDRLTDIIGPAAFVVHKEDNPNKAAPGARKGSKREIAKSVYLEFKDTKTDKEIISLIAEELEVTTQNAYTYLYNVKKLLAK